MSELDDDNATLAVARLYHAWITGLVLSLVNHRGADLAAEFVFRLFRRQHLQRFLPGLEKLGLNDCSHAVAAAKYHYFSNQLGGVKVEYLEESARKAWIRYPPPRWIWAGTAICAIPLNVNHAMLRGWHAHNGVSLNNPRLGFVCTKTTVAGDAGLEGYYYEYDYDLDPSMRLRFVNDESCPPIAKHSQPQLAVDYWPPVRRAKAYRNYAMEYVRNGLPLLVELLGEDEAHRIGRLCGRQIGMQCFDEVAPYLDDNLSAAAAFAQLFETLLGASGDTVIRHDNELQRTTWRLFPAAELSELVTDMWLAPFEGMLAVHDRFLSLDRQANDHYTIARDEF